MFGKCTVLFDDPFWIAIFEKSDETGYQVARHVFGALPNEAQLLEFSLNHLQVIHFSHPTVRDNSNNPATNFKRRQRQARKLAQSSSHLKQAWQAIQAEREILHQENHRLSRQEKENAEQEKYLARQEQKKRRHRDK